MTGSRHETSVLVEEGWLVSIEDLVTLVDARNEIEQDPSREVCAVAICERLEALLDVLQPAPRRKPSPMDRRVKG